MDAIEELLTDGTDWTEVEATPSQGRPLRSPPDPRSGQ